MKAPMTSKSDLGLFQIPNYRQGVRTLSLAAAIWMSTSLAGADTPVGGAGVLAGEVPQDLPANLGVTPALPDSIHFGKCLDLVELQDGTIIMMVGAPDDDDRGRLWSQGNASGSVFVYRRDGATSQWVPFGPPNAPENKPVDFKLYSPTPQPGEQFGWSLDLDVDEEGTCRAVIGAPGRSHEIYTNSDGTRLANAGAAYVYVLDNDGCWILEQRLTLPMVDFEWSNDGASDIEAGTGTKVQVFPISDWPERLPYDPFDPNADPDTLNEQLRIGVNAPQNEAVPVELSAPFDAPNGAPMAQIVSVPGERFGFSVSILGDTIAVGAPQRSVHLFDLYDGFDLQDCPDIGPDFPWVTDRDNRLWESGVTLNDYRSVAGNCQRFLNLGGIGAPGVGGAFLFQRNDQDTSGHPWWLGGVDPELIAQTPPTSWEDPYFRGRILHDDLGNTLAWNVALGSMVKLHRVTAAEGDQPAVVDLIVSAPQADFTFTGMTHVYRDVWNRPPHTRSDIALRDANAGFNSPGKYGFDLDTVQVDDDGYLIAIGQPGFNFAGYPGFSWNGTAHTYFVPHQDAIVDNPSTPLDEALLPTEGFSFSIPRSPSPVQTVCDEDDGLIRIPGCTDCSQQDVVDFDLDGVTAESAQAICLTGGDPYNLEFGGFGMSVDLVDVGDQDQPVLLVGAPRSKYLDDFPDPIEEGEPPAPGNEMSGVIYSYKIDVDVPFLPQTTPTAIQTIEPKEVLQTEEDPGQYQLLGQFVRAIEAGGDVIIAGAQPRRSPDEFVDFGFRRRPGAVAVFDLDDDGEDSNSDDNLASLTIAPDVGSLADRSNFGQAIDVGGDIMVVSSPYATLPLEGEAFDLYEVMNTFPPESAFPTFTGIYGLFGASERMGEVRVYRRNGGCSDIGGDPSRGWVLVSVIRPPELNALEADPSLRRLAPFVTPNMGFGTSVDLSSDGKFLVVGAEQGGWRRPEDAISGSNATGGAYLYELANEGCDPIFLGMPGRYLNEFGQPLQGALGSRQGKAVSVENRGNNGYVMVGAPSSSLGGTLAGYATVAEIRSNQLSFQDPIRLPPNDLGIPGVGIAAEQGRKAFDLTGDAVALTPGSPRIGVFSSPNRRYFNGDPGGPTYLEVRGRVSSLLTFTTAPTQTLLPELGMENFGGSLAVSRTRSLVAIGLDTDRLAMNGLREPTCSDFGGAVQVRSVAGGNWSGDFVSLPFLTADDPTWCPPQSEFGNGSLDCVVDGSLPLTCTDPIGDWTNRFSEDYGSVLSFSEDGQTLLIGDMRRRTAGSCLQNPDSTRSGGVFDVWTRVGVTNSDFCDWNRTGIGFINDGRRGRRLGWDVAIDEAAGEFVTSNFASSVAETGLEPDACSPLDWATRSAVWSFSPNAKDCNGNGVADQFDLDVNGADCDGDGQLDACQISADPELDLNLDTILDSCQCLSDVTGDGVVDQSDVDAILQWIQDNQDDPTCFGCPEDVNGDGLVDIADVVEVNLNLGACP